MVGPEIHFTEYKILKKQNKNPKNIFLMLHEGRVNEVIILVEGSSCFLLDFKQKLPLNT